MATVIQMKTRIITENGICNGQPFIEGTRIKVQQIALEYEHLGWSPDQICDAHPTLMLTDVHDALAYYYHHKTEIDATIRADDEFAALLQRSLADGRSPSL